MVSKVEIEKVRSKTAILLTLYSPNVNELLSNILSYKDQVNKVIVCDNSLEPISHELFSELEVISLLENKGIAFAQNRSLIRAIELGYEYFIEMDQDSSLNSEYVEHIIKEYIIATKTLGQVLGIGPLAVSEKDNFVYHDRANLKGIAKVNHTLSSGFFYSKTAVEISGLKDEGLFIDLVDWEWCMRAQSKGLSTFVTPNVRISHTLGDKHLDFKGCKLGVPKPFRHYYQFRNTIELIFRSYIPITWKYKNLLKLFCKIFLYPVLLENGLMRLKYMLKGAMDGFKRCSGPLK